MNLFFRGFEKKANIVRKGLRTLGNITGARHLKAGIKDTKRLVDTKRIVKVPGKGIMGNPAYQKRFVRAENNLRTGAKRMAGTGLAVGATAYGVNRLNKSANFDQESSSNAMRMSDEGLGKHLASKELMKERLKTMGGRTLGGAGVGALAGLALGANPGRSAALGGIIGALSGRDIADDRYHRSINKSANLATKGMGILGKGPLKSVAPKLKQPKIPQVSMAIRGNSSMKI